MRIRVPDGLNGAVSVSEDPRAVAGGFGQTHEVRRGSEADPMRDVLEDVPDHSSWGPRANDDRDPTRVSCGAILIHI